MRDAQLSARAQQMKVVDPLHLRVVGIDDLPVEDVLRERNLAREKAQWLERFAAAAQAQLARVPALDVGPLDPLHVPV